MHIDFVNIKDPNIVYPVEVPFKNTTELAKKVVEKRPFIAKFSNGNTMVATQAFLSEYFPVIIAEENVKAENA